MVRLLSIGNSLLQQHSVFPSKAQPAWHLCQNASWEVRLSKHCVLYHLLWYQPKCTKLRLKTLEETKVIIYIKYLQLKERSRKYTVSSKRFLDTNSLESEWTAGQTNETNEMKETYLYLWQVGSLVCWHRFMGEFSCIII